MTAQKDLKKRIRARMAETGESYAAARAAFLAEKPKQKCDACNGHGYTKGAPGAPWEKVDCKACNGSGKIEK